jgi:tetratricopeptide (TPR) repeat protein
MNMALELYGELGSVGGEADTLCNLGSLRRQTGDYPPASVNLMAAIKLYRDLGDLYLDTAAPAKAREMYARALAIAADIGLAREEARARGGLLRSEQAAEGTANG